LVRESVDVADKIIISGWWRWTGATNLRFGLDCVPLSVWGDGRSGEANERGKDSDLHFDQLAIEIIMDERINYMCKNQWSSNANGLPTEKFVHSYSIW
jgi:hypothetical protein